MEDSPEHTPTQSPPHGCPRSRMMKPHPAIHPPARPSSSSSSSSSLPPAKLAKNNSSVRVRHLPGHDPACFLGAFAVAAAAAVAVAVRSCALIREFKVLESASEYFYTRHTRVVSQPPSRRSNQSSCLFPLFWFLVFLSFFSPQPCCRSFARQPQPPIRTLSPLYPFPCLSAPTPLFHHTSLPPHHVVNPHPIPSHPIHPIPHLSPAQPQQRHFPERQHLVQIIQSVPWSLIPFFFSFVGSYSRNYLTKVIHIRSTEYFYY